jgi:hypothetical protein
VVETGSGSRYATLPTIPLSLLWRPCAHPAPGRPAVGFFHLALLSGAAADRGTAAGRTPRASGERQGALARPLMTYRKFEHVGRVVRARFRV